MNHCRRRAVALMCLSWCSTVAGISTINSFFHTGASNRIRNRVSTKQNLFERAENSDSMITYDERYVDDNDADFFVSNGSSAKERKDSQKVLRKSFKERKNASNLYKEEQSSYNDRASQVVNDNELSIPTEIKDKSTHISLSLQGKDRKGSSKIPPVRTVFSTHRKIKSKKSSGTGKSKKGPKKSKKGKGKDYLTSSPAPTTSVFPSVASTQTTIPTSYYFSSKSAKMKKSAITGKGKKTKGKSFKTISPAPSSSHFPSPSPTTTPFPSAYFSSSKSTVKKMKGKSFKTISPAPSSSPFPSPSPTTTPFPSAYFSSSKSTPTKSKTKKSSKKKKSKKKKSSKKKSSKKKSSKKKSEKESSGKGSSKKKSSKKSNRTTVSPSPSILPTFLSVMTRSSPTTTVTLSPTGAGNRTAAPTGSLNSTTKAPTASNTFVPTQETLNTLGPSLVTLDLTFVPTSVINGSPIPTPITPVPTPLNTTPTPTNGRTTLVPTGAIGTMRPASAANTSVPSSNTKIPTMSGNTISPVPTNSGSPALSTSVSPSPSATSTNTVGPSNVNVGPTTSVPSSRGMQADTEIPSALGSDTTSPTTLMTTTNAPSALTGVNSDLPSLRIISVPAFSPSPDSLIPSTKDSSVMPSTGASLPTFVSTSQPTSETTATDRQSSSPSSVPVLVTILPTLAAALSDQPTTEVTQRPALSSVKRHKINSNQPKSQEPTFVQNLKISLVPGPMMYSQPTLMPTRKQMASLIPPDAASLSANKSNGTCLPNCIGNTSAVDLGTNPDDDNPEIRLTATPFSVAYVLRSNREPTDYDFYGAQDITMKYLENLLVQEFFVRANAMLANFTFISKDSDVKESPEASFEVNVSIAERSAYLPDKEFLDALVQAAFEETSMVYQFVSMLEAMPQENPFSTTYQVYYTTNLPVTDRIKANEGKAKLSDPVVVSIVAVSTTLVLLTIGWFIVRKTQHHSGAKSLGGQSMPGYSNDDGYLRDDYEYNRRALMQVLNRPASSSVSSTCDSFSVEDPLRAQSFSDIQNDGISPNSRDPLSNSSFVDKREYNKTGSKSSRKKLNKGKSNSSRKTKQVPDSAASYDIYLRDNKYKYDTDKSDRNTAIPYVTSMYKGQMSEDRSCDYNAFQNDDDENNDDDEVVRTFLLRQRREISKSSSDREDNIPGYSFVDEEDDNDIPYSSCDDIKMNAAQKSRYNDSNQKRRTYNV